MKPIKNTSYTARFGKISVKYVMTGLTLLSLLACSKGYLNAMESDHDKIHGKNKQYSQALPVQVVLNEQPLLFPQAQALNHNGIIMLPADVLFSKLGYSVYWNAEEQKISADKADSHIEIWPGKHTALVNNKAVKMQAIPYLAQGSLLVHSDFISDVANCLTEWDAQSQSVQISCYNELDYKLYFYDGTSTE